MATTNEGLIFGLDRKMASKKVSNVKGEIERKEFSVCREKIESGESLIINGKAGRGKSGCTADIASYCEEKKIPYIAIKLDKRIPDGNADKWGRDF